MSNALNGIAEQFQHKTSVIAKWEKKNIVYDPLAQLVEHLTFNQGVGRSSRPWVTILEDMAAVKTVAFFI